MFSLYESRSFHVIGSSIRSTITHPYEFVFCKGSETATRTTGMKPCWYTCFPVCDYGTCPRQNCLSAHTRMHWLLEMKFRMKGNKKTLILFSVLLNLDIKRDILVYTVDIPKSLPKFGWYVVGLFKKKMSTWVQLSSITTILLTS